MKRILSSELALYARNGELVSLRDIPGAVRLFEGQWYEIGGDTGPQGPPGQSDGVFSYQVENLAPGDDIGDGTAANARTIFMANGAATFNELSIISQGTSAGINDANPFVVSLYRGTNLIVSKTYNTANPFPADHAEGDLGVLANNVFSAGEDLRIAAVGGATADVPRFMLQGFFSSSGVTGIDFLVAPNGDFLIAPNGDSIIAP